MNTRLYSSRIFITGASSGIGKALALAYAREDITLGLAARRRNLLEAVTERCRQSGAHTYIYPLDVQNQKAVLKAAGDFVDHSGGIDLVIANAGIGGHDDIMGGDPSTINEIIKTNLLGVTNTLLPFIPVMKKQSRGTLVIVSSVMAFLAMPYHGGYSAVKSALVRLADSWRPTLKRHHIQITTVCPGFVETPLTEKRDKMVFLLSADAAARNIIRAIEQGKKTFIFPWQMKALLPLLQILPMSMFQWWIDKNKS